MAKPSNKSDTTANRSQVIIQQGRVRERCLSEIGMLEVLVALE